MLVNEFYVLELRIEKNVYNTRSFLMTNSQLAW